MKLKDVFLGLCVAALLISELFLFSANRQKEAAQSALRDAKQQIGQLQKDLQQATNSNANAKNMEFARLRSGNQDLPRLRNAIQQLTETNRALAQQLEAVRAVAQQQQQQLQEWQAQNQQVEAVASPQSLTQSVSQADAQADADRNACINNLRQIDAAKQQWALEKNKAADAIPTAQDLLPYLPNGIFPTCPSGGTYLINPVNEPPACSIPGHVLP
jgi:chromosome segregation ATPase